MISTRLIRCSRITSDEENVNKLLCDARLRDFCDGELNYMKTTHSASRFLLYIEHKKASISACTIYIIQLLVIRTIIVRIRNHQHQLIRMKEPIQDEPLLRLVQSNLLHQHILQQFSFRLLYVLNVFLI